MIGQRPAEFPFAAALVRCGDKNHPSFPIRGTGFAAGAVPRPDDLRVGAHEGVLAPALLLHAVAALEQLVVAPAVGDDEGGALNGRGHGGDREAKRPARAVVEQRFRPGSRDHEMLATKCVEAGL